MAKCCPPGAPCCVTQRRLSHSPPGLLPPWERLPHRVPRRAGSHEPSRCVQAPRLLRRQKHLVAHLGEEVGVRHVGKPALRFPPVRSLLEGGRKKKNPTKKSTFKAQGDDSVGAPQKSVKVHLAGGVSQARLRHVELLWKSIRIS